MTWRRQQQLLATAIAHHLETGRPVGSESLAESVEGRWSSATIRAELAVLEEMGYLRRLHASSGRVPTDRGFRFLVDRLLARDWPVPATAQGLEGRTSDPRPDISVMRTAFAAQQLAQYIGFPVVVGGIQSGQWQCVRGGLTRILGFSEFDSLDTLKPIVSELESGIEFESVLKALVPVTQPVVKIGREISVPALEACSIVAMGFPTTGAGVIVAIGPKRMPYVQIISGLTQWATWIEKIWNE